VKSRGVMVGALAVGFVVVVWYMMVYSKAKDDVSSTKSQVSEAQQQTDELTRQKKELESLEDEGPAIAAKLDALHAAVPAQPELAKFIDDAYALEKATGVAWVSVAPSEPTLQDGVGTIPMTIQVNGDYFNVIDYLDGVEGMSRLVVVDTINLTAVTESDAGAETTGGDFFSGTGPELTVTLTARMFTQAVSNGAPVPAPAADAANTDGSTTPTTSSTTNVAEG
jgi:Tfp pilus assembly protein PilO